MNSNDIVEIIHHLYISNWYTSNNPEVLKKYNIKAIITLETTPKTYDILHFYKKNNIDHLYIYIYDLPNINISEHFDETYDFINKHISKNENVLVHCMAGVSRSATIILNYLLRKSYETNQIDSCPCNTFRKILNYVRNKRKIINPNPGFQKQLLLKAFEYQKIKEKI